MLFTGRITSVGFDRARVTRPRPVRSENILARPDPTREISDTPWPNPARSRDFEQLVILPAGRVTTCEESWLKPLVESCTSTNKTTSAMYQASRKSLKPHEHEYLRACPPVVTLQVGYMPYPSSPIRFVFLMPVCNLHSVGRVFPSGVPLCL